MGLDASPPPSGTVLGHDRGDGFFSFQSARGCGGPPHPRPGLRRSRLCGSLPHCHRCCGGPLPAHPGHLRFPAGGVAHDAGVGAVHALAYPLGGKFKVPHGVANALLLPYVMKYNVLANLSKFAQVAAAMGENIEGLSLREAAEKAVRSMACLASDIGIPENLKEVGVTEGDIPLLAQEASKIDRLLGNNPRQLTLREIETIYKEAFIGKN